MTENPRAIVAECPIRGVCPDRRKCLPGDPYCLPDYVDDELAAGKTPAPQVKVEHPTDNEYRPDSILD